MGLDLVDFFITVEETFDYRFGGNPDIATPRKLIHYLWQQLPPSGFPGCLSQRAFYNLRTAFAYEAACDRMTLRPDTILCELVPERERCRVWERVREDIVISSE